MASTSTGCWFGEAALGAAGLAPAVLRVAVAAAVDAATGLDAFVCCAPKIFDMIELKMLIAWFLSRVDGAAQLPSLVRAQGNSG